MLAEIAEYARFADEAGFAGFGHPEHHLQIESFEASNEPTLMGMWLGQHTKRLRVITCGFVSTTHNPLRTAESIATMDHMLGGRFSLFVEFLMLLGAMLMVDAGALGWAWGYAIYTVINALSAWLILSGRV